MRVEGQLLAGASLVLVVGIAIGYGVGHGGAPEPIRHRADLVSRSESPPRSPPAQTAPPSAFANTPSFGPAFVDTTPIAAPPSAVAPAPAAPPDAGAPALAAAPTPAPEPVPEVLPPPPPVAVVPPPPPPRPFSFEADDKINRHPVQDHDVTRSSFDDEDMSQDQPLTSSSFDDEDTVNSHPTGD